ncbi:MAG: AraC family transcriptional regulator [Gemmatimonadota bacterium]
MTAPPRTAPSPAVDASPISDYQEWTRAGVTVTRASLPVNWSARRMGHDRAHLLLIVTGSVEHPNVSGGGLCRAGWLRASPAGDRNTLRTDASVVQCLVVEAPESADSVPLDRSFSAHPRLISMVKEVARSVSSEHGCAVTAELSALELFAQLSRRTRMPALVSTPWWLVQVRDALHDEFTAPPELAEIAARSGHHPIYLARAFRQHFGLSVGGYLRRLRIQAAMSSLRSSERPLSEVAFVSGFADQSHMTRALRAYTGMTPRMLRHGRSVAGDCTTTSVNRALL